MASNLFRRKDRLFHARQRRDFSELAALHIGQTLCIFGQPHMAHAPLDVVDVPPLTIHGHDRDVPAGDIAVILEDACAVHQVLPHAAALDALLPYLAAPDSLQLRQHLLGQLIRPIPLLTAVQRLEDADRLGHFFDLIELGHEDDICRSPVELVLVDFLGQRDRIVSPLLPIRLPRHRVQHPAPLRISLVLAFGLEVKEHG